jgi:glycosyltransferase involved in cell wall biosynthesis
MTDWHTRTQRTQQLVWAFANLGFRCIYINPHLGRQFDTTSLFDKAHRMTRLEQNVFELHIRLPREPVFHDRLLTQGEQDLVVSAIQSILPQRATVIQILSFPLWFGIARRFRDRAGFPIIYDCHDLLAGFQNICADIIADEVDLLKASDLVLFSSEGLVDCHGAASKRWLLIRNAVAATESNNPAVSKHTRPPVVGYIGALESWFDIEAIERSAFLNPNCCFLLAGRIDFKPIKRLKAIPNVDLVGEIPYSRVPELLSRFRVALIPFRINPLTKMTNPIKLYEYFSFGLPVVTTPLPEVQAMGDLVYVGKTPTDFALQVTRALQEDDPTRPARRRSIAALETWAERAQAISREFGSLYYARHAPGGFPAPPL